MSRPGWKAALYLEKGHIFFGKGFGSQVEKGGEAVFNTGMSGYQEIFTDPSYSHQIVVMTSTQLGNTGINPHDVESPSLYLKGVVAREYFHEPSNWRATENLSDYLNRAGVPAISDVDTRQITRVIRDQGAQRAVIFKAEGLDEDAARLRGKSLIESVPSMEGLELVSLTSCKTPWEFEPGNKAPHGSVVVYDFGVKLNILRSFARRGFKVQVVPYNFPFEETLKMSPVAVVLSNGPGDPARVPSAIEQIQGLIGKKPIYAICMGHQLLARSIGAETYKLKFGHHGINHPVLELETGRILITSQNHGFAVDAKTLKGDGVRETMVNLNDKTNQGFASEKMKFYSVQFHPEAKPGPSDADYLFDQFIKGFVR